MIKKNNILLTQEFVPVNILNISIAFGQIERTKKLEEYSLELEKRNEEFNPHFP